MPVWTAPDDRKEIGVSGPNDPVGTYPANLCLFLWVVEFADLGDDFGEAVGEAIEETSAESFWKSAAEHFDNMLVTQADLQRESTERSIHSPMRMPV